LPDIVPPAFGKAAGPVAISVLIEFANLSAVTWSSDICLVSTPFVTIFVAVTWFAAMCMVSIDPVTSSDESTLFTANV